jgi:hypothetical protein
VPDPAMVLGSFRKRPPPSSPVPALPMVLGSFRNPARRVPVRPYTARRWCWVRFVMWPRRVRPCIAGRWCWVRFVIWPRPESESSHAWPRDGAGFVSSVACTSHLSVAAPEVRRPPRWRGDDDATLHRSTIGPSGRVVPLAGEFGGATGTSPGPRPGLRRSTLD